MVDVAQLVRVADCGSEGRGFESHLPPQNFGLMAEWLGRGLQNLVQRFESASDLSATRNGSIFFAELTISNGALVPLHSPLSTLHFPLSTFPSPLSTFNS